MCREAYNFVIPLEKTYDRVHVMRLDQGPTASFKDFAAQMMARLFGHFLRETGQQLTILTATSGDTGAAVAHAFHNIPGVRVIVLFPFDEVSRSQRKMMTTLADNVRTVAIDGKFDDCQAMVKRAFADPALATHSTFVRELHQHRTPVAAECLLFLRRVAPRETGRTNRVLRAERKFRRHDGRGRRRSKWVCQSRKLIAPVNDNDAFPRFLETGHYEKISPSRNSVSNAMNVGHPSNLARLVAVYGGRMDETGKIHQMPDLAAMRRDVFSSSVSDERTRDTIREVWNKYELLLEAHGAVAWRGFLDWLAVEPMGDAPAVIFETANPAKFPEEIEKTIGFSPDVPAPMEAMNQMPEDFDRMNADYEKFREYLIQKRS